MVAEATTAVADGLLVWSASLGGERLWALEDCRQLTRTLERTLLDAGEQLRQGAAETDGTPTASRAGPREVRPDRRARRRQGRSACKIRLPHRQWKSECSDRVALGFAHLSMNFPGKRLKKWEETTPAGRRTVSVLLVIAGILIPVLAILDPGYFSHRPIRVGLARVIAPFALVAGIRRLRR